MILVIKSNYVIFMLILMNIGLPEITAKPNILLIVTDDQDVVLHGMLPMVKTQRLLAAKGATFMNAFTSSPICCPSRSSILSGMYAHNHGAINNSATGGCYGNFWKEKVEPQTLAVHLQKIGYETFFAGKYLNEYFTTNVPPGWDEFYGLHGNSRYYNYTCTENGQRVKYGNQYYTDVLSNKVIRFIEGKKTDSPFFAMIAPPAPHAPFTPAPRHNGTFKNVKSLRTPNFNIRQSALDKHWLLTMGPVLSKSVINTIDEYYRKRWESLLAVDDLVENVVEALTKTKTINNTYIILTSDNGYHIGQFGQPFDKRQPYETDVRVPLIVRGPTIPTRAVISTPTVLIDLFPSILEWAGSTLPPNVDGKSFVSELDPHGESEMEIDRLMLLEYWGEGTISTYNPECPWKQEDRLSLCTKDAECLCQDAWNNTYSCIRHFARRTNKVYCEFRDHEDFVEAYDLNRDPYQLQNIGYTMLPSERAWYSLHLQHLRGCRGDNCRKPYTRNLSLYNTIET